MEPNTFDLILAAHVRIVAIDLRRAAIQNMSKPEWTEYLRAHPLTEFVPAALEQLKAIAVMLPRDEPAAR